MPSRSDVAEKLNFFSPFTAVVPLFARVYLCVVNGNALCQLYTCDQVLKQLFDKSCVNLFSSDCTSVFRQTPSGELFFIYLCIELNAINYGYQ